MLVPRWMRHPHRGFLTKLGKNIVFTYFIFHKPSLIVLIILLPISFGQVAMDDINTTWLKCLTYLAEKEWAARVL